MTTAHPSNPHLTDSQFSDALLGEPLSLQAQAHVAQCERCRLELAGFDEGVADLRHVSQRWSEARSATLAPVQAGGRLSFGRSPLSRFAPAYAWAAAGILAVGITVPLVRHAHSAQQPAARLEEARTSAETDSPEQIARDNQLLAQVHFELTRTDLPAAVGSGTSDREGRQP